MSWLIYFTILCTLFFIPFFLTSISKAKELPAFLCIDHTNIVKGLAIVLVMMGHSMQKFSPEIVYFTPTGGIGVALFLICSGFGLNESSKKKCGTWQYWYKRFITVIVPYSIFEVITYWSQHQVNIINLALDLFCIKSQYQFGWYLSYLMLWYLIFYLLAKFELLKKYRLRLMSIISCVIFIFARPLIAEQAISFLIGIYISEKKNVIEGHVTWKNGLLFFVCGVCALAFKQIPFFRESPKLIYKFLQLTIKLSCAIAAIVISYLLCKKINMKIFLWLGRISFELYLVHGIILSAVSKTYWGMASFIIISTVVAWIFNWINIRFKRQAFAIIK